MAIREYKCETCGLMTEKIIQTSLTPPPSIKCPRCEKEAMYKSIPSRIGIMTDNFGQQKVDVMIGHDADRRWADINSRQQTRDAVRQKTGQLGLSMIGRNEFAPLSQEGKEIRTEVNSTLVNSGLQSGGDTPADKKILGLD